MTNAIIPLQHYFPREKSQEVTFVIFLTYVVSFYISPFFHKLVLLTSVLCTYSWTPHKNFRSNTITQTYSHTHTDLRIELILPTQIRFKTPTTIKKTLCKLASNNSVCQFSINTVTQQLIMLYRYSYHVMVKTQNLFYYHYVGDFLNSILNKLG